MAFWDWGPGREVTGFEWFLVVFAFLLDVGAFTQGGRARATRDDRAPQRAHGRA